MFYFHGTGSKVCRAVSSTDHLFAFAFGTVARAQTQDPDILPLDEISNQAELDRTNNGRAAIHGRRKVLI